MSVTEIEKNEHACGFCGQVLPSPSAECDCSIVRKPLISADEQTQRSSVQAGDVSVRETPARETAAHEPPVREIPVNQTQVVQTRRVAPRSMVTRLRAWLFEEFYPESPQKSLSGLNRCIAGLIVVGCTVVVLETEPTIYDQFRLGFDALDDILACLFGAEYIARLWVVGENPRFAGLAGRLRYITTPMALIDLLSVAPFLFTAFSSNLFLLRIARLFRIVSLAKFGRYSRAMNAFMEVLQTRKPELLLSLAIVLAVLLVSSSLMYAVEGAEQPEAFGSIPRALWWGVTTLTTVGYGDVYPRTVLGKICCGGTALAAIGLIAMPTAILAAAFTETFARIKQEQPDDE